MRVILFMLLLAATPAAADQVNLSPGGSAVAFRAYGLGIVPFDGKFTRFHGLLRYDAGKPGTCQIMLEIDAASLVMEDPAKQEAVLGPEFMDSSRFPAMAFDGACAGSDIAGTLRLHGEAHPFTLETERARGRLVAVGRLRRAEWGITARPFVVGPTIRIRVELPDPVSGPHA